MNLQSMADSALSRWLRAQRSGASHEDLMDLWNEYSEIVSLTKAGPSPLDILIDRIVRDETARFRGRKPSPGEWMIASEAIARRIAHELSGTFTQGLRDAYIRSVAEVASEAGRGVPWSRRHEEAAQLATRGTGLAQSFRGLGNDLTRDIKRIVVEGFQSGESSPRVLSQRMVDVAGWRSRGHMETIAITETTKVKNEARYNAYKEFEDEAEEKWLYRFGMKDDEKTCPICTHIMRLTEEGVLLEELRQIIIETSTTPPLGNPSWNPTRDSHFPVVHPRCRHTWFRVVPV